MPESMSSSTLAPLAAKLTATKAADIDLSRLKLPAGFKIEVWADSVPGVRAIAQGDKRVLLIAGRPVPYALARIPQGGEVRGNLAAGGKGVAQALSARDREIAEALGPTLAARGLLLVGLDIIGDRLTEINVTSPTCFQEISDQTDCDVAALFVDALEQA